MFNLGRSAGHGVRDAHRILIARFASGGRQAAVGFFQPFAQAGGFLVCEILSATTDGFTRAVLRVFQKLYIPRLESVKTGTFVVSTPLPQ